MPEKVTISHRGARYEIGRGKRYYAIWAVGAPRTEPVDRWPETRQGWSEAWTRFVAIETPGTIAPVARERAFRAIRFPGVVRSAGSPRAAAGLLGLGIILGLVGLFPDYFHGQSLVSVPYQLLPHAFYLAVWTAAAALILLGGARARIGALAGTGLSAVTLGLFIADLATGTSGHAGVGPGMTASLIGWLACTAGAVLALREPARDGKAGRGGSPAKPRTADWGPITLLTACAIGTAATFVPSWDSYTLLIRATGASQTVIAGNAFANPGTVVFGNIVTMAALIAVAAVAALWRPARQGAALLAGAIVVMAGQAISALIQVSEPASPERFGFSPAQAARAGLTITSGVTPIFWVYVVFVIALVISCAWMLTAPLYPAMPAVAHSPGPEGAWSLSENDENNPSRGGDADGDRGAADADGSDSSNADKDEDETETGVQPGHGATG